MGKPIERGKLVVCNTGRGRMVEDGKPSKFETYFPRKSVAEMRLWAADASKVYVIGKNEEYLIPTAKLSHIDPLKTGKGYAKKICNICHVLKSHDEFEINQTDAKGRKTSRPSCRICRRDIDKKPMSAAAKREAEKHKPPAGTVWKCPICQKRSIVAVTAKVVLDHRHSDGALRAFLCDSCNTGLGRFKNGGDYLRNAIAYLEQFEKKSGSSDNGNN